MDLIGYWVDVRRDYAVKELVEAMRSEKVVSCVGRFLEVLEVFLCMAGSRSRCFFFARRVVGFLGRFS